MDRSKKLESDDRFFSQQSQLSRTQCRYLANFFEKYNKKTKRSKVIANQSRSYLCNNRKSSSGFRVETKELCYPIIATKSQGSNIWDIDGNQYIDLSMGYGSNLFGHNPSFIQTSLLEQVNKGYQIGPECEYVAQCAKLIAEISNKEKVLFANSGTEAIMTAMRIARAFRKKDKIVIFENAYHGHYDSTLVVSGSGNGECHPMWGGIPKSLVEDIILLPYADDKSIEAILNNKDKIAAVLVEPVQNSQPHLHPRKFLESLRHVTREHHISLIFDEILVGFRIAYGGAQEYFNVDADLVTYGKIIGGGLPLSAIAGKADHMNLIDGGMWHYGDLSAPSVPSTFTAGTFCKHPLAMSTCYATLSEIKEKAHVLYPTLNERSAKLFNALNKIFDQYRVPLKVCSFGSFFRFAQNGNLSFNAQPLELDLFSYHLIEKGIYVWECKTCFICTDHTDSDLEKIIEAAHRSIVEMKENGFWSDLK